MSITMSKASTHGMHGPVTFRAKLRPERRPCLEGYVLLCFVLPARHTPAQLAQQRANAFKPPVRCCW